MGDGRIGAGTKKSLFMHLFSHQKEIVGFFFFFFFSYFGLASFQVLEIHNLRQGC